MSVTLSPEDLLKIGIHPWQEIEKTYKDSDILIGNGFSVNISERLRYDSLYDTFQQNCGKRARERFNRFGTSNFEYILEQLVHASNVNEIFAIENDLINKAIEQLKTGLISTVGSLHPDFDDTDLENLGFIAEKIGKCFYDIYTLNYDLFLYRIILLIWDKCKEPGKTKMVPYGDYFYGIDPGDEYLEFIDKPLRGFPRNIHYLHGALFIFQDFPIVKKIRRGKNILELIKLILEKIENGNFPLFISEGSPEAKEIGIKRSEYLSYCLENLEGSDNALTIYGSSLSEPDKHIVRAINENKRKLAISIHPDGKSVAVLKSRISNYLELFEDHHKVEFFDSRTLFPFL